MNDDRLHLWERDKRQIESIVRTDIIRGREYNSEVCDRYPKTFTDVDPKLAKAYYHLIWSDYNGHRILQ